MIMMKAVRYDEFGGIDELRVDEVERPVPGDGQVLVRVKAAGINPSEGVIRSGAAPGAVVSLPATRSSGSPTGGPPRLSWPWSKPATSRASPRRSHGR